MTFLFSLLLHFPMGRMPLANTPPLAICGHQIVLNWELTRDYQSHYAEASQYNVHTVSWNTWPAEI